jgi:hypothetical protein
MLRRVYPCFGDAEARGERECCVDRSVLWTDTATVGIVTRGCIATLAVTAALSGCGGPDSEPGWQIVASKLPGAMMSVWGTSASDVFVVGGDTRDGHGPNAQHFDGTAWTRLDTGQSAGNLWWVFGFPGGPVYMGGDGGTILRYQGGSFTRMTTPGIGTVFGIWGASNSDLWAVGGDPGGQSGGFAWRLSGGDTWATAPGFPTDLPMTDAIWKMYGRSASDAWMVGTRGKALHWDGSALALTTTGAGESLFTVHADEGGYVAVGGAGTGVILENTGNGWQNASPSGAAPLVGVCLSAQAAYAVGQDGAVYTRDATTWSKVHTGLTIDESFHAVWIDPTGGVWAVGGEVSTPPYVNGIVVHLGQDVPEGL